MKQSQRIVKNAFFGIGGSVIGGLVYLATVLIIAHAVSVREFGKYSFVLAFAMFVNNIADSGLPRMLVREVASIRGNPESAMLLTNITIRGGGGILTEFSNAYRVSDDQDCGQVNQATDH